MPPTAAQSSANNSTRTRILEAALEILRRDGPAKASMAEIARRAGLSRQGLYIHFSSKDELTYAAARHAFEVTHANVQEILAGGRPFTERLVGALAAKHALTRSPHVSRAARFWQGYEAPVIDRIIEMSDGFDRSFIALLARALEADGAASLPDGAGGPACGDLAALLDGTARGLALAAHPVAKRDHAKLLRIAVTRLCAPSR